MFHWNNLHAGTCLACELFGGSSSYCTFVVNKILKTALKTSVESGNEEASIPAVSVRKDQGEKTRPMC